MIHLVGPGGAGKSTVGVPLASRLESEFVDLDRQFMDRAGDISNWIDERGYHHYARENVETYLSIRSEPMSSAIVALSSGFMTYPEDIHPEYLGLRSAVSASPMTFILLPSLDLEICVAETVRRQVARPFGRTPEHEEAVIRERFTKYMEIPAKKVETMRPVEEIVTEIVDELPPNWRLQPTASGGG
jgi:shikimate kinase